MRQQILKKKDHQLYFEFPTDKIDKSFLVESTKYAK